MKLFIIWFYSILLFFSLELTTGGTFNGGGGEGATAGVGGGETRGGIVKDTTASTTNTSQQQQQHSSNNSSSSVRTDDTPARTSIHRVTFNTRNEVASEDTDGSLLVTYCPLEERIRRGGSRDRSPVPPGREPYKVGVFNDKKYKLWP